jgi:uncharacterized cupredoxin-like copper-binding protein
MYRPLGPIAVLAAAALCACSQKEAAKPDSVPVAQAGAAAAAASQASFDPTTRIAVVHAKDFAFDAPDSITAGWTTFHLVNDGPNLHHVQLVRLDSGKTAQDLADAMKNPGPPPRWAVFAGGPNAPDPSTQSDATLNLAAGNYVMLCLVDMPGGVPHFTKGMVRPFKVTAASGSTGTEPTSDVAISLADYKFNVEGTLGAGKHIIKVQNAGPQIHEIEVVRLAPGKTLKDLQAWMQKPEGPPPANAMGGIDAIPPGTTAYFTADLTPGDYAMLCFIPDAKDGKAHLEHGMVKQFKVS